MVWYVAV